MTQTIEPGQAQLPFGPLALSFALSAELIVPANSWTRRGHRGAPFSTNRQMQSVSHHTRDRISRNENRFDAWF
jgi:hypothetical protein